MQPPQSATHIMGVGVGKNKAQAHQAAVVDITSQLALSVAVKQDLVLSAKVNKTQTEFSQSSELTTLPFSLEGLEQVDIDIDGDETAILLSINKLAIVKQLQDDLNVLVNLSPPAESTVQSFIWALQYGSILNDAAVKIRILSNMSKYSNIKTAVNNIKASLL